MTATNIQSIATELTIQLKKLMTSIVGIGFADVVTLDNDLQSTVYYNGSRVGYIGYEGNTQQYFFEVYNSLLDAYQPVYYKRLSECIHFMLIAQNVVK